MLLENEGRSQCLRRCSRGGFLHGFDGLQGSQGFGGLQGFLGWRLRGFLWQEELEVEDDEHLGITGGVRHGFGGFGLTYRSQQGGTLEDSGVHGLSQGFGFLHGLWHGLRREEEEEEQLDDEDEEDEEQDELEEDEEE